MNIRAGGARGTLSISTRDFRAAADKPGQFQGYGSVFGVEDSYGTVTARGAFSASLAEWQARSRLPAMLWQHSAGMPIGTWTEMREDDVGLWCVGQLLLTVEAGKEAYELLQAGAIDGLSIGFQTVERTWNNDTGVCTLNQVRLWEVSLVTFPANESARVDAVRAADGIRTIREFEEFLRDEGGFSHSAAKAIASRGFKDRPPRDEGGGLQDLLGALRDAGSSFTRNT